ncbi:YraN family protein [Kitasatospora sp. NPDC088346]|uniref:YraN family protein n=1 Tax=Kitasatospora sp. NPDC088346 TaxID=3364073 RepID=UPI00380E3384
MQSGNNGLGRYGEEVAARWLVQGGLRILERNWRCAEGELDIVALDGDTLAVCEVKTRSERGFQQPTQAIDQTKAERLHRLAQRWLDERWPVHFDRFVRTLDAARVSAVTGLPDSLTAGPHELLAVTAEGGPPGSPSQPDQVPPPTAMEKTSRSRRRRGKPPGEGPPAVAALDNAAAVLTVASAPPPPGGVRIDLVAVVNRRKGAAQVEHLRGAI